MEKKKKKSGRGTTVLLFVILITGLSLLLYPSFSDYWNSMHQTYAITTYNESVQNMDKENYELYLRLARRYNENLREKTNRFVLTDEDRATYEALLNLDGYGVMGYIEIPSIEVSLPIYHGTEESVLQVAIGHVDWTSLPVGGAGSHCVLSGHRGLPSAKLFTHLDKLVEGDVFVIRVLDEVLTYEVDQILIVEPQDVESLQITDGKDYCTLVTCTPYGINTHRLLVRGHRIENTPEALSIRITSEMIQIDELLVASILAVPILLLLVLIVCLKGSKKRSDVTAEEVSALLLKKKHGYRKGK